MALSNDRSGTLVGPILLQHDFDLPANGEVFLGGMYRVVGGVLVTPVAEAAQDGAITVYALEHKSNRGGQDRAVRARCMVKGQACVPRSGLTEAAIGQLVYPTSDDALAATAVASNRPLGTLLAIDSMLATVLL